MADIPIGRSREARRSAGPGERLAVYVALNLEHYAFGEGMLDELVPLSPPPDVLNFSWLDYGNRVGAWRLPRACSSSLELPLTVLVNSKIYRRVPELIAAFRAAGCEIAAHGRTNAERQGQPARGGRAQLIAEATGEIARHEGTPPRGWLGPWISESEHHARPAEGSGLPYVLDWCHDDRPSRCKTRAGPLCRCPIRRRRMTPTPSWCVAWSRTGSPISCRPVRRDAGAGAIWRRFGATSALVCPVSLHPHVTGQAHRLRHLRRAFTHIAEHRERIWTTRAGDIADVAARGYGIA